MSFAAALRAPETGAPDGLQDGRGRSAERRFDIYRNNVAVSLIEALEAGFPATRAALGPTNFRNAARDSLRRNPPTSPVLTQYGAAFPADLAAMPQLASRPWLADLARLEWALRESYHAADHTALSLDAMARAGDGILTAQVGLAPSVRVLRSDYPVLDLWRHARGETSRRPEAGAQEVAILRPDFDPRIHLLPPGGVAFLSALRRGVGLAAAAPEGFDPAPVLGLLAQSGALTSLVYGDATC